MSDLPDDFDCTLTNWEYIYGLCRNVSNAVKRADFEPDVVVALARGGWFAGRCICDFLGLNDLTSLKMEHYVGAAEKRRAPRSATRCQGSVEGKDVLIIDDIADTGGSIRRAEEYVDDRDAGEVRTATLQLLGTSEFQPDFVGERLEQWTWVVYPWNFLEDMIDLTEGAMERADQTVFDREDVRHYLDEFHGIGRIEMEVAQAGRLDEVLDEMVRRDVADRAGENAWTLAE